MKLAKRLALAIMRHPIALRLAITAVLAVVAVALGAHHQILGERDDEDDFLL